MNNAPDHGIVVIVLAAASAVSALSFAVAAVGAWSSMAATVRTPAATLFLRVACTVLLLSTVHHATDLAAAVGHANPSTQAVTSAALASMGAIASGYVVRYGWLMRHFAAAPGMLGGAMRRAAVAEMALGESTRGDISTIYRAIDIVAGKIVTVERRVARDSDATEIIERMMQRLGVASTVTIGQDLVVTSANEAFWRITGMAPTAPSPMLADALRLTPGDAARLSALGAREGATLVVQIPGADGGYEDLELTTEYLPREHGGRMWVSCRRHPRANLPRC